LVGKDFVYKGTVITNDGALGADFLDVTIFEQSDEESKKGQHSVTFCTIGRRLGAINRSGAGDETSAIR
jgi:hypothetical protein